MVRAGSTSIGAAAGLLCLALLARSDGAIAQAPAASAPRTAARETTAATLTRYCVTCHNERVKTAGFVIDTAALTDVGTHAEAWEKVVRKLRTTSMPPASAPRPDAATYDVVATFLETELDGASAAKPQLGK